MNGLVGGHTAKSGIAPSLSDRADDANFVQEAPPIAVGQSERRMQVRAYNHWASLLGDRALPPLACLNTTDLADFSAHGVIIDLAPSKGSAAVAPGAPSPLPAIRSLGARLADDCSANLADTRTLASIATIADVPDRSVLSRLTAQYRQVLSNNAPLSFEGEFANNRGITVQYRGILLPFSDDDSRVEQIFGVINWREVAGDTLTRALHKEMHASLRSMPAVKPDQLPRVTMADWADGPAANLSGSLAEEGHGEGSGVYGAPALLHAAATLDHGLTGRLAAFTGQPLAAPPANLPGTGPEFALVMIRRDAAGDIHVLGEIPENPALINQAAHALLER